MSETERPPRVAVVIVSYNTCALLHNCLRSVYAPASRAGGLALDVIVVDNGSQDGSVEMAAVDFPQALLIPLEENIGFTGGNNLALHLLGFPVDTGADTAELLEEATLPPPPDYVLLLNPDARLVDDALPQMARFLRDHPAAGVCGANLTYADGRFQHGAFKFPSLAQVALDLFPLTGLPGAHRLHASALNGRYSPARWQGADPFTVDFVLGAAMMVRGAAIHQVGGLDDAFFMYCEEMDWSLRLSEAGWSVHALPTAHVVHYEAQSSGQVRWAAYERLWRSRFRFYEKHRRRYSPGYLRWLRLLVRAGLEVRAWQAQRHLPAGR